MHVLMQQSQVPEGGLNVKLQDGLVTPIRSDVTRAAERHFIRHECQRQPPPAVSGDCRVFSPEVEVGEFLV
jgi:hypothetical protein